ncbi:MAG TPA: slipin family protein [Aggregatilineales bacterium]|jgi:regulator of protease activity HflC (stomatin/prohibitin superfamily)|nr:slipin family protein [Chloroflexota bacterium]HOA23126.1 slipin family protein [Aggregatilineales bacterium]HPV07869.1 slipin family protein [Aggregatilineales bacterium]HQE17918.1 slipin family protein [Aggregatilineales bacterium]
MDVFTPILCVFLGIVVVVLMFLGSAVRIVQEYERGVIFRLGRVVGAKGPGLFFIIPVIDRMVKVDLRTVTLDVPPQEMITNDNVTVKVNAVAYFRVVDPEKAIIQVENYRSATYQIAQTSLRSVIGEAELDEVLAHRDRINTKLQRIIDEATDPWGIKVSMVEVKDVELPPQMQRAMARQAEAEREKRAKIIHAEGEFQAAQQLREAADTMAGEPQALQLRFLQTLTEIAAEKNSTVIFPVPVDIISTFTELGKELTIYLRERNGHKTEAPGGVAGEIPRDIPRE